MGLPKHFFKLQITKHTYNFRDAVQKILMPLELPKPENVLIKTRYAGVNALDVLQAGGRYEASIKLPADCGLDGIGQVVAIGSKVEHFQLGQAVGFLKLGALSEYVEISEGALFPLPSLKSHYLPLLLSGLTAAISLSKVAEIKEKETVLVTAAAGGTGQFLVQLAKQAGCHVIATCSTKEKKTFLETLGCDHIINYNEEFLRKVLKEQYKDGINLIYESRGLKLFQICVNRLANNGRLVVLSYRSGHKGVQMFIESYLGKELQKRLLKKSATLRGCFVFNYPELHQEYLARLINQVDAGQLKSYVDFGHLNANGPFIGLDSAIDAVEHVHSQDSRGKVVVELPDRS